MREDSVNVGETEIRDKITSIRKLVRAFEMRLQGHEWRAKGDKFEYTGKTMAGTDVINKGTGLLQPYCEEANLITTKMDYTFFKQKWRVSHVFNDACMVSPTVYAKDYRTVIEMFRDTLQNIGDVIHGSRNVMNQMLVRQEEPEEEGEY